MEEWHETRRKKQLCLQSHTRSDITHHGGSRRYYNKTKTTTYFFLDNHNAKALANIFQKYDTIEEMVIPLKKDKRGEDI